MEMDAHLGADESGRGIQAFREAFDGRFDVVCRSQGLSWQFIKAYPEDCATRDQIPWGVASVGDVGVGRKEESGRLEIGQPSDLR
jgi:hypothetical protein